MTPAPDTALSGWLERLNALDPTRIELGLDRVRLVAQALGILTPSARVLTVAGTNGKGSTVALAEAVALAGGLRVASYTSPHILRFNERVRVNGREAGDDDIVAGLEAVEAARGDTPLTYFEFITLAALWHFSRLELDVWILEIGLGGRLDVVNVIDPDVAVITSIGLDHQDWLGHDRDAIAREKAGILRPGRPVVVGEPDPPPALRTLLDEHDGAVVRAGSEALRWNDEAAGPWRVHLAAREYANLPEPGIGGACSRRNAATAIAALDLLLGDLPPAAVVRGVSDARIVGRLQRIGDHPPVIVDTAHNPQAAGVLARSLMRLSDDADGVWHCVLSMLADKDVAATVRAFERAWSEPSRIRWYFADSPGPRGLSAQQLAERADRGGDCLADVPRALDRARDEAGLHGRVVCFGSFLTVESALRHLHE